MEYMEHSNFYAMCDKIRKMEANLSGLMMKTMRKNYMTRL